MIIREKEIKDCKSWVEVNVSSWNDNLKGIVSDNLLNIHINNKDERIKKDIVKFKQDDFNYVLEEDSNVVGILKVKESERENFKGYGEVQILYLSTDAKGKGFGRALLNKGLEVLKDKGYNKIIIGCLVGNPSNEFYKHMGGKFICQEPWDVLGEHYVENIYEFDL